MGIETQQSDRWSFSCPMYGPRFGNFLLEKYLSLDFWGSTAFIQRKFPSASIEAVPQPTPPSPPSRGAADASVGCRAQASPQKRGIPRRISQTRVGSPEGRNSPLWCSFLHFSQEKWRPPAGTPPGRCAPRPVKALTTRRVPTTGGEAPGPTLRVSPAPVLTGPPADTRPPCWGQYISTRARRRQAWSQFSWAWSQKSCRRQGSSVASAPAR